MGYYAWSQIDLGEGKVIKVGDEVSPGDVDLDDEAFQAEYVETGVVREQEFPDMDPNFTGSPDEWVRSETLLAAAGEPTWEERKKEQEEQAEANKDAEPVKEPASVSSPTQAQAEQEAQKQE